VLGGNALQQVALEDRIPPSPLVAEGTAGYQESIDTLHHAYISEPHQHVHV
jgi:hypothetical protein